MQQYSPQRTLDQLKLPSSFSCLLVIGEQESPAFKTQLQEYKKVRPSFVPVSAIASFPGHPAHIP